MTPHDAITKLSSDSLPHMDREGIVEFVRQVELSKCFLEYGCGGSTIFASTLDSLDYIISVDSDPEWLSAVRQFVRPLEGGVFLHHVNIGEVSSWGVPNSASYFKDFWRYSVTPWTFANEKSLEPDIILIDGRFRVACFLFSIIHARQGATILFDDYFDRPEYHICASFTPVLGQAGRMAIFKAPGKDANVRLLPRMAQALVQYSVDWD